MRDSLDKIHFNIVVQRERYFVEFAEDPLWRDGLADLMEKSVKMRLG